jgi:heparan-alpha-glucosaminide N-acetyltransferase
MLTSALYLTGSYDPEGTLGNLTSIFMVFLGLQSGRTLMAWKDHKHRVVRWYIWSIVLGTHLSLRLPWRSIVSYN